MHPYFRVKLWSSPGAVHSLDRPSNPLPTPNKMTEAYAMFVI